MQRYKKLQAQINDKTMIVSDPTSIYYLTGYKNDPGMRMMLLVLRPNKEATMILNNMFPRIDDIHITAYKDGDDVLALLDSLIETNEVYVDGRMDARFLIPLLKDGRTFIDGSSLIENMRRNKDADEISKMKIASMHNDRIMLELTSEIYEGMSEKELTQMIVDKQNESPLTGVSFNPIAVFTENAADPHGHASDRKLKKGDVILIDMGGIYQDYRSDMTRCFFFGENKKIEEIYDIVLEANLAAIDAIAIGVPLSTVDKAARDVITKHGYGEFFTHRTGHGIGLDTHETLDVSSANDTLIEAGMCFSIEPGIYLEGVGGIRIEDLICVTKDEVMILNSFPKTKTNLL